MENDDCVFCTPEQFFEPAPCVGQLELPFDKADKRLMLKDHQRAMLDRYPTITVAGLD